MNKLNGIHFGSYWMGDNDVVFLMASELSNICNLIQIDTRIYANNEEKWFFEDLSYSDKWPIRWLNKEKIIELINKKKIDFIVINSGGMTLTPSTVEFLRRKKIITIGISLSDPDVFPENGKIYSQNYDLFYTNSQYALNKLYVNKKNIRLLPFAASTKLHRPLKDVDKIYDVVVIAHAKPERIQIIKKLKNYFNIGLFGNGWGNGIKSVNGEEHVKAINLGKIYLSFSKTSAGFTNVKVGIFEAIACRTCVATEMFNEMESYFEYGIDILGYRNISDLINLINTYINNDKLRNWIANNSYRRLLKEHTWKNRWINVLNDIQKCKEKI